MLCSTVTSVKHDVRLSKTCAWPYCCVIIVHLAAADVDETIEKFWLFEGANQMMLVLLLVVFRWIVDIHSRYTPRSDLICEVLKKLVIKEIRHRFTSILNRTFSAAQLQPLWCTWKMKLGSRENYCLTTSASHVVYQFTCSCRGTYIDRTWMPEHIPKWLTKRLTLISSRAM